MFCWYFCDKENVRFEKQKYFALNFKTEPITNLFAEHS